MIKEDSQKKILTIVLQQKYANWVILEITDMYILANKMPDALEKPDCFYSINNLNLGYFRKIL